MVPGNIISNKRVIFEPSTVFHVYNHGNADDNIFREEKNYLFFLKRFAHYIVPVARVYAFCLMPNHFHFMVQIRSKEEIRDYFRKHGKDLSGFQNLTGLVSKQFSNLLNSYTKAFNKKYNRRGKLFLNSLERKPIRKSTYFKRLIYYIHQNPVSHGFVENPGDWPYSSYSIILSQKQTQIKRDEILKWFGGKQNFQEFHRQEHTFDKAEFFNGEWI